MSNLTLDDALSDLEPAPGMAVPTSLGDALADLPDLSLDDALSDMAIGEEEGAVAATADPASPPLNPALTPGYYQQHGEPGLGDPQLGTAHAAALGGIASVLETKDFLFGEPEGGRPEFDKEVQKAKEGGIIDGLALGVGQFAVGMYGLGKFTAVAKALPWFGRGAAAIEALKGGKAALETAKAATVGAVAFDPHEERLSNLIQDGPLANPLTQFLAADPSDTNAEGRMKAALESIGLDTAIIGTLGAAAKVYKALRAGDAEGARAAAEAGEAEAKANTAPEQVVDEPDAALDEVDEAVGGADSPGGAGTPEDPYDLATVDVPKEDVPVAQVADDADASRPAPSGDGAAITVSDEAQRPNLPAATLTEESTGPVLDAMRSDADAIAQHGSREAAINAGHTFGKGESIPYAKLTDREEVNAFLERVVDAEKGRIVTAKGGAVLHDAEVERVALDRAKLFGDDPATFIGRLRGSADAAVQMVADAEAGRLIVNRLAADLTAFAQRIQVGDFSEFGGDRARAFQEFGRRHAMLSEVHASASAITSNSARATRLAGVRLQVDPAALAAIPVQDTERLIGLFAASDGTPQSIARLANPSLFAKGMDVAKFVLVNNLISGWTTQVVNMLGNSYMVGVRPLERIIGATPGAVMGNAESSAIVREAVRQYAYTATALVDGFMSAVKTLRTRDSVLAPQSTELYRTLQGPAQTVPAPRWRPWTTPENALHNVFASILPRTALNVIGTPMRLAGFTDELAKQTVYRSKVMARAHLAGSEEVARLGLKGAEGRGFHRDYVRQRLEAAFDGEGRGTDKAALLEAEIATFSQDLPAESWGRTIQQAKIKHPGLGFILPFVKTPTNILRYGWKMTPVLNLLQAEYRRMLKGELGAQAKAQAMGEVAIGTAGLLAAASLASMGTITGGGPRDPKLRQELMATGWQPYSVVVQNDDGSRSYYGFGRLDPIAIPFGMVADIQDAMAAMGRDEGLEDAGTAERIGAASLALGIAITKQFRSKTYLKGFSDFLEAINDPGQRLSLMAGQMASNFVPFASLLRQTDSDPYMREARGVVDRIMDTVPGLGANLSPRFDAFGDPILSRNGLWSSDRAAIVDREMQRLALENGAAPSRVGPTPQAGVDLRDITMSDGDYAGRNAYEVYQELSGHLPDGAPALRDVAADLIDSDEYRMAPDGDAGTGGTKLSMLTGLMGGYRSGAMGVLRSDTAVQNAFMRRQMKAMEAYEKAADGGMAEDGGGAGASGRPGVGSAFGIDLGSLFEGARQ